MSFEKYTQIFYDKNEGKLIRPMGKGTSFSFACDVSEDKSYRLFVAGEVGMFYQWKNEPDHPVVYKSIGDSLYASEAERSGFALSFSSKRAEKYIRRVYKKIVWEPRLSYLDLSPLPENWEVGIYAKAKGLKIEKDGYLRMRIAVRYLKDGVSVHSNMNPPDAVYVIDIPEGDYGYERFSTDINLPKGTVASVGVFVEGVGYSGNVFVENPFFIGGGYNILPDFAPPVQGKEHFDWTGQYFSHKEWPEFRVTLNGERIFEDEVFERCHRDSEWEISLPRELLSTENTVEIELITNCHDPLPYTIHELGIIEQCAGAISLVATSEVGVIGGYAYALIRTERDNTSLKVKTDGKISAPEELFFKKAGLHGIRFSCGELCETASLELSAGGKTVCGNIKRVVIKEADSVYTGTGDMIYIHQDAESAEEYLSWYLSSGIGNLLTIRPAYRWSGTRVLDRDMWREVARVLNEWDMKYPVMLDGRELEGLNANPDAECISGGGYLGRQMHERDGAMFYWRRYDKNTSVYAEQYEDMGIEIYREDPTHTNPVNNGKNQVFVPAAPKIKKETDSNVPTFEGDEVDGEKRYNYKNPNIARDMKIAHDYTVGRLRELKSEDATRHTGPSVTFKYFLEAGFSWVGDETMYGTLEEIMPFLRGATRASGISDMGVHHALQWSSSPHDAPEHMRRFRIALYSSYMQGATEINTEEGLWRLEEYFSRFNRFSNACTGHTKEQQDFYRYVSTHTRRGKFYTPMALIHGRYDGFNGFARDAFWGFKGVSDTDAEKSWDLLSVFYREGTLGDPTYCHNCPTDKALGFYASTPIGNIDAIPIETSGGIYKDYKAIAFMGYNYAEKSDFEQLYRYVSEGGRLLLTLAHTTVTTDYNKIILGDLEYSENAFAFTDGKPETVEKTVNGSSVFVAVNIRKPSRVIAACDDGTPLVVSYDIGAGEVTLFAASAFPANKAIRSLYEAQLTLAMKNASKDESVWAEASLGTQFAVYERDGERDVYFLAADWYRPVDVLREAKIRIGENIHTLKFPFGVMIKASASGDFCAYPHSEDAEVISVKDGVARLQGTGRVTFTFINGAESREETIDFTDKNLVSIKI